jgi:hypothetical protein
LGFIWVHLREHQSDDGVRVLSYRKISLSVIFLTSYLRFALVALIENKVSAFYSLFCPNAIADLGQLASIGFISNALQNLRYFCFECFALLD